MAGRPQWHKVGVDAAELYQRHLVPGMFARWAPRLVDAAGVRVGQRVADLACGTGVVARRAAERVGDAGCVVGLDLNAAMLGVARALPMVAGTPIGWVAADAGALPLPDAVFDVVLCQQGLQQFTQRPAALAEMYRVLRAAGRLAAGVWGPIERSPGMAALVEALARHVGAAAANNRRAPFALSDADELGRLVRGAGFRDVAVSSLVELTRFPSVEQFVAAQLAATPLATLGGMTDETRTAVLRDVSDALRAYVVDDGLAFPMQAHIVIATTVVWR